MAIKQCDQRKGGMEGRRRNGEAEDTAIKNHREVVVWNWLSQTTSLLYGKLS